VLSGIGSLLSKGPLQGISTATRNPIAPWNVLYGRGKLGGTIVYINQWGSNNAWIDLVIVLNCHNRRASIRSSSTGSGSRLTATDAASATIHR
jgi:hypothetical protein